MTIAFVCPTGHQLTAPKELAGKPGKCPKCGTKFLVPTLAEAGFDEESFAPDPDSVSIADSMAASESRKGKPANGSGSAKGMTAGAPSGAIAGSLSGKGSQSGKGTSAPKGPGPATPPDPAKASGKLDPTEQIVFLCPNGHKLNGPASLKGKAGKCPHCNAKFLIPTDEDLAGEDSTSGDAATGRVVETHGSQSRIPAPPSFEEEEIPIVEVMSTWQLAPPSFTSGNHLAELFTWMWEQRPPSSVIELILKDGQSYSPKLFSPELSHQGYGVFIVPDDLGRYTMTALAWDQVAKVVFRNLDDFPEVLFE